MKITTYLQNDEIADIQKTEYGLCWLRKAAIENLNETVPLIEGMRRQIRKKMLCKICRNVNDKKLLKRIKNGKKALSISVELWGMTNDSNAKVVIKISKKVIQNKERINKIKQRLEGNSENNSQVSGGYH